MSILWNIVDWQGKVTTGRIISSLLWGQATDFLLTLIFAQQKEIHI